MHSGSSANDVVSPASTSARRRFGFMGDLKLGMAKRVCGCYGIEPQDTKPVEGSVLHSHTCSGLASNSSFTQAPVGARLARECGVSANRDASDPTPSRASLAPTGPHLSADSFICESELAREGV